jgi:hypothetical protein
VTAKPLLEILNRPMACGSIPITGFRPAVLSQTEWGAVGVDRKREYWFLMPLGSAPLIVKDSFRTRVPRDEGDYCIAGGELLIEYDIPAPMGDFVS